MDINGVCGCHGVVHAPSTLILTDPNPFLFPVGAASNKQHVTTKNTAKLDRETEELRHQTVSADTGKLIMQGRQAKGLSQKDLATVSRSIVFLTRPNHCFDIDKTDTRIASHVAINI